MQSENCEEDSLIAQLPQFKERGVGFAKLLGVAGLVLGAGIIGGAAISKHWTGPAAGESAMSTSIQTAATRDGKDGKDAGKDGKDGDVPSPKAIYLDTFQRSCPQEINALNPQYSTWEMCQVMANAVNQYAASGTPPTISGFNYFLFAFEKTSNGLLQVSSLESSGSNPSFDGGKKWPCCTKSSGTCNTATDRQFGPAQYYLKCEYIDTAAAIAPGGSFFTGEFFGLEADYCVSTRRKLRAFFGGVVDLHDFLGGYI
eukprot:g1635.t1